MNFKKLNEVNLTKSNLHTESVTRYARTDSAITLIALVITIIALLILAGVSLSLVSGGEGIIAKAQNAVEKNNQAKAEEELTIALAELKAEYYNAKYVEKTTTASSFEEWLKEESGSDQIIETKGGYIEVDDAGNLSYTSSNDYTLNFSTDEQGSINLEEVTTPDGDVNDVRKPTVQVTASTTNSITFTAIDTVGLAGYAVTQTTDEPTEWTNVNNKKKIDETVTGLIGQTKYYIWAKDTSGNISDPKEWTTNNYEEIKYTAVQKGSNFTVTVTTPTDTSNIVYKIGSSGAVTAYTGAFEVPSGETFAIWNSENQTATIKSSKVFSTITITYDENGGSGELPDSVETEHTRTVNVDTEKELTKTGYTFLGWALTNDATAGVPSVVADNKNMTLYAVWSVNSYTVTFEKNNNYGTIDKTSIAVNYGTTYSASGNTITFSDGQTVTATPGSYTGYTTTVSGWSSTSGTITDDEEITVSFSKVVNSYTIAYNANGGSGTVDKQTKNRGTNLTLRANGFTAPNGQHFVGWNTNSSGTGTSYAAGAAYSSEGDATLYAVWTNHSYTSSVTTAATCTGNGVRTYTCGCGASYTETIAATGHSSTAKLVSNASCTAAEVYHDTCNVCGTETRSNYSSGSALGHSYSNGVCSRGCGSKLTYTLSFNANGGDGGPSNITFSGQETKNISSTIPTRTGYTFYGWSASSSWSGTRIAYSSSSGGSQASDGTKATTTSGSWSIFDYASYTGGSVSGTSSGTLTLYAQWRADNIICTIPDYSYGLISIDQNGKRATYTVGPNWCMDGTTIGFRNIKSGTTFALTATKISNAIALVDPGETTIFWTPIYSKSGSYQFTQDYSNGVKLLTYAAANQSLTITINITQGNQQFQFEYE